MRLRGLSTGGNSTRPASPRPWVISRITSWLALIRSVKTCAAGGGGGGGDEPGW
jgi:hypothetical protein